MKDIFSVKWVYAINPVWKLKWPISLIFSPESLERYRRIHQFLLQLYHVSYCLQDMWLILKRTRILNPEDYHFMTYIGMYFIIHFKIVLSSL